MRLDEILSGPHARLYHSTSPEAAADILRANCIEGRTRQTVDARRGRRRKLRHDPWRGPIYGYDLTGGRTLHGLSLTRSYDFAFQWKVQPAIFVLDQTRLRQDRKLIPTDHVNSNAFDYTGLMEPDLLEQAEEFLPGDLDSLDRYLVSVNVDLAFLDRLELLDFSRYEILARHPKLNVEYPAAWRQHYHRFHHDRHWG